MNRFTVAENFRSAELGQLPPLNLYTERVNVIAAPTPAASRWPAGAGSGRGINDDQSGAA